MAHWGYCRPSGYVRPEGTIYSNALGPVPQDQLCELPFEHQNFTHFDTIPDNRGFSCPESATLGKQDANSAMSSQWCEQGGTKFCPEGGWVMHHLATGPACVKGGKAGWCKMGEHSWAGTHTKGYEPRRHKGNGQVTPLLGGCREYKGRKGPWPVDIGLAGAGTWVGHS